MNVIKILCLCCANKFSENYNGSIYHPAKVLNVFFGLLVFEAQTTAVTQSEFKRHGGCLLLCGDFALAGSAQSRRNNFNNGINLFRSNQKRSHFGCVEKHEINIK